MRRFLIGFSYNGTKFTGFQRGNGHLSVEGEILKCTTEFDLGINVRSASRTDRSVSALNNYMTIDTEQKPENLLGIMNSHIRDVYFHSYSLVEDNFNVRHAMSKTYAYIIPVSFEIPQNFENILEKFEGTHDFTKFSKPEGRRTIRTIDRIWVERISGFHAVFFRSRGFLWNQIRFIMGYILNSTDYNMDPFETSKRMLAPPQNLILVDIKYENIKLIPFRTNSLMREIEQKNELSRNEYAYYNELNSIIKLSNTNDL